MEVIVVEGHPQVNRDIVAAFARTCRPHVVMQWAPQAVPNGKGVAMNQGASMASCPTLMFVDADLTLPLGLVKEGLGLLESVDIVSTLRRHIRLGWSVISEPWVKVLSFVTAWCCMMEYETLVEVGAWGPGWPVDLEDVGCWIEARRKGMSVAFASERVVLHRRVGQEFHKTYAMFKQMVQADGTRGRFASFGSPPAPPLRQAEGSARSRTPGRR